MAKSESKGTPIFAAEHNQGRSNIYRLDPRDIVCDWSKNLSRGGMEPPVDDELIGLAESMAPKTGPGDSEDGTSGQLNPVLIRQLPDRRAELVGGFRRYRAALWLVETGRCSDFQLLCNKVTLSDAEAALTNMDENMQRSNPEPLQLAHAIRTLHEGYGMQIATIAKRLRKSSTYINYLLKLTGLPSILQEAISDGTASVAAMAELTDLPAPVAISVFNATKEAKGIKVRAKDLTAKANGEATPLPTPSGTPSKAAAVAAGKGPKIQASDIRKAKQERVDKATDSGEAVTIKAKNRTPKEVLAGINDLITPVNADPAGKKLAKMVFDFVAGEKTADQLAKAWFKQFPVK
jgi:ParB/RepB/Spo0J family partition protein